MWRFRTIPTIYMQAIRSKLASRKDKENPKAIIRRVLHKIYKQRKISSQSISAPTTFVYPFGAFSDTTESYIRGMGFQATFVCESRTNVLTQNPECLYGLGRYLRTNETDSAAFFQNILKQ